MEGKIKIEELPFDQYQRYKDIQIIIDKLPKAKKGKILDVGGYPALIKDFVNSSSITVTDILDLEDPDYVKADATKLPFKDKSFETVVSLDTLEHIKAAKRAIFIKQLARVCKDNLVLIAPFKNEVSGLADKLFQEFYLRNFNHKFGTLQEHIDNGLPNLNEALKCVKEQGFKVATFPSGYVYNWLPMMFTKTNLWSVASNGSDTKQLEQMIDNLYNCRFYESDHREPSYRTVIIASKQKDAKIEEIADYFKKMGQNSQDQPDAFFSNMLMAMFDMRNRHWEKSISDEFQRLHKILADKDQYINGREEHLKHREMHIKNLEERNAQLENLIRKFHLINPKTYLKRKK